MIKILQVGLGPLGQSIAKQIAQDSRFTTVASVDLNPDFAGKKLNDICQNTNDSPIYQDLKQAVDKHQPDIAVVTTVSSLAKAMETFKSLLNLKLPVVSSCEELSYPWREQPDLSKDLDAIAQANNVAILGTGVNPGFLMDALPSHLSLLCKTVEHVRVNRYQNALSRRIPFQEKIGAGLSLEEFEQKKQAGTLRHVGLTESMHMIAAQLDWPIDSWNDEIKPIMVKENMHWNGKDLTPEHTAGVEQIGTALVKGEEKIRLHFKASIVEEESYDQVILDSEPKIDSKITGGVHGDVATHSILLNTIKKVLTAKPGLRTMIDV
ncbi:hypothetical protein MRY82_10595 [bacterium]|nr:hypothetical protein [bacterium]